MIKVNREVLEQALEAVQQETGKQLRVHKKNLIQADGRIVDAIVDVEGAQYHVEIKRWAQHVNFGALVYQLQQLPGNPMLVADYINQKLAIRLKEAGVPFIDTFGNAYIEQDNLYVNVRGNRTGLEDTTRPNQLRNVQRRELTVGGTGRAFTPTGLKVVYEFIRDPALVQEPYRDIAERTGVALGTVGWVINDLKARGFLLERGKTKRIKDLKAMIMAWVEAYPQKLRYKNQVTYLQTEDPHWWVDFDVQEVDAQWGGETAAAKMTNYLKPQIATVYLRGALGNLIKNARLAKAKDMGEANVVVYRPFWGDDEEGNVIHPVVVYADLIATGDPRNLETAKLIYDEYLDRDFGKNLISQRLNSIEL